MKQVVPKCSILGAGKQLKPRMTRQRTSRLLMGPERGHET